MSRDAAELHIGQKFPPGQDSYIKELHELCPTYPGPHVHVLHTKGHTCISLPPPKKGTKFIGEWSGSVWNIKPTRPNKVPKQRIPRTDLKAAAKNMAKFAENMQQIASNFKPPEPPKVGDKINMVIHQYTPPEVPRAVIDFEIERKKKRP